VSFIYLSATTVGYIRPVKKLFVVVCLATLIFYVAGCDGSTKSSGTAQCQDAFALARESAKTDIKNGRSGGDWSDERKRTWARTLTECANSDDWISVYRDWSLRDSSFVSPLSPYFRAKLLRNECERVKFKKDVPSSCLTPNGTFVPEPQITLFDCWSLDPKPSDAKFDECLEIEMKSNSNQGN